MSPKRISLALLLGLALTACAPAPEPATVRLLDQVGEAQVEWPRGGGARRPRKAFLRAVGLPDQDPRRVGRLVGNAEEGFDNRAAIGAPTGSIYRFALTLPERPVFRAGLGVAPAAGAGSKGAGRSARKAARGGKARFVVRIEGGRIEGGRIEPRQAEPRGEESEADAILLDEVVSADAAGGWVDREIDLAPWSGKSVTLILETLEVPPGDAGGAAAGAESSGGDLSAGEGDGMGWAAWSAPEIVVRGAREEGWDLLLISLDTLRADHLGSYGYPRSTSPHLDALAGSSIRFARAVTASPWTNPSHRAMLSGLFPLSSGGLEAPRLAEALRAAGYRTTAFTGGGQVDYRFGFARGFDEYRLADWIREPERVIGWMEANRERRRFVFLHTYEVHDPYVHSEMAEGMPRGRLGEHFGHGEWLRLKGHLGEEEQRYIEALYDGGIAYTDRKLHELLDRLESRGLLDKTVVIVTSDHGEQFFEHGSWRHGMNLYDEQVHVPLILRLPAGLARELGVAARGRVIEEQASLVDLVPTVLDLLGVPRDWQVNGRSLLPLLRGESVEPRQVFTENTNIRTYERKSLRTRRYKYIHSYPKSRGRAEGLEEVVELYDLARDPAELENLAGELSDTTVGFEELLAAIQGAELALDDEDLDADELDPDLRKRLEALGYVN
jgi:Sulfatase